MKPYLLLPFVLLVVPHGEGGADGEWTRWGGPRGDFHVTVTEALVESWSDSGPDVLWERELGGGYSAILCQGGRLFTLYHEEGMEIVVALEAETGELLWDYAYAARRYADISSSNRGLTNNPWCHYR